MHYDGGWILMLYEGNWFCWEWNRSGLFVWIQKEKTVEVLVLPTSVISFLVKATYDYDQKLNHANQSLNCYYTASKLMKGAVTHARESG